jgi:hypothetical protein
VVEGVVVDAEVVAEEAVVTRAIGRITTRTNTARDDRGRREEVVAL